MKSRLLILLALSGLLALLMTGCYTQLRTSRDYDDDDRSEYTSDDSRYRDDDEYRQDDEDEDDDNEYRNQRGYGYNNGYGYGYGYGNNNYGYGNWGMGMYGGYSSYWPSSYYSSAWNNMWGYDYYGSNYGSYYNPWYCGTPYLSYPHYSYWWYPQYYYRYSADSYTWGRRNFGNNRGRMPGETQPRRTEYSGYDYNTSSGSVPSSGTMRGGAAGGAQKESYTPAKRTNRSTGTSRGYSVERSRSPREGTQSVAPESNSRGQQRGSRSAPAYVPTYRGRSDNGGSRGGSSSGSSAPPSYTPPASSQPNTPQTSSQPSSPPPARESRPAPSNSSGSGNSGSRRGGRP